MLSSSNTCTAALTIATKYSITCKNILKTWKVWLGIDLLKCISTAGIFLVCFAIVTSKTNYTTTVKMRIFYFKIIQSFNLMFLSVKICEVN